MPNMNNDMNLLKLRELIAEWEDLFHGKAPLEIQLNTTASGMLTVNGTALCHISQVDVSACTYDVEFLFIYTTTGSHYEIYLSCPNEGHSEIGYINLITPVYSAVAQQTA